MDQPVFIQVGALADGFAPANHTLPPCDDLAGRQFQLYDNTGRVAVLSLSQHDTLQLVQGNVTLHARCRVTSLRPLCYLIDGLPEENSRASLSLVLDLAQSLFTRIDGLLPDEAATRIDPFRRVAQGLPLTAVEAEITHGTIDRPVQAGEYLHHRTNELIGMRNLYRYSQTECYEHIYLNDHFYAWQCLQGVEQGLADVDRCYYVKLADALYLFVWCEKIVPTLGVVLIDLAQGKTDGKIVGYQGGDFSALSNFAVGAQAKVLNTTHHPLA